MGCLNDNTCLPGEQLPPAAGLSVSLAASLAEQDH